MIVNCKECEKEVSDQAVNCPNCGVQLNKSEFGKLSWGIGVLALIFIVVTWLIKYYQHF